MRTFSLALFALLAASLGIMLYLDASQTALDLARESDRDEQEAVVPPTLKTAVLRSPEAVCSLPSTILCEDFESSGQSDWSDYKDNGFNVQEDAAFGGSRSLRQIYDAGQVNAGWLAWFFGDHPQGGVREGESFEEVYFRFYHRFEEGWPASYPPKLARVRSHYVDGGWRFAWAEHLWIDPNKPGGVAISAPVSSIPAPAGQEYSEDRRWLGTMPLRFRFTEADGEWVALEARIWLNTPGRADGRITYWVNGEVALDRRRGVNLRGAYTETTINVAMLDTYWNGGAPRGGLRRWYDNIVVATEPIGCASFSVEKEPLEDQSAWQLQVAETGAEDSPIWDSGTIESDANVIEISQVDGSFTSGVVPCVTPSDRYGMRARQAQAGEWSSWSEWRPLF